MKKFMHKASLLFLLLIFSCSGSGDDESQTNEYIDLFISSTTGFVGETIIFSVFDGEGNNVSTSADFYVNEVKIASNTHTFNNICLLYTSPSPRDNRTSRMPSSA